MQAGEFIPLITIGILSMTLLALGFIAFFNFSQKKIIQEKIKAKDQELKHQEDLLHHNILTQEKERLRIAKDLHDDIGSKLNVIHLNLFQLKGHGDKSVAFQDSIHLIQDLIHKTIHSTRRISHELLPPTLEDFGLASALEELVEEFNRSGEIQITFNISADNKTQRNLNAELSIFRIIQEMITNSIRHGQAKRISLHLSQADQQMTIKYQDDGCGMDMNQFNERKGLGLKNIDSRLKMLGASIQYQTEPGKGFKAVFTTKT